MRKVIFWGAVLIGGYLVLNNFKGANILLGTAGSQSTNLVKAFQGR